ncbi:hypothetical protein VB714_23090 [Spirulina sp. 06S082]|nr:hypothetical protein [Spirulina sp. 06S082]
MNNEMNQNWDSLYSQFLSWLKPESEYLSSSETREEFQFSQSENSMGELELEMLDPLDWEEEEINLASSAFDEPTETSQSFTMGKSIVQKRFQALLQRKLQEKIERNPPLFPWETELTEYDSEYVDETTAIMLPSRQLWLPQVAGLIPVPLPDRVLSILLDTCTEAMGLIRPQNAKMVKAVKALFPEYARKLDNMLGNLLLSPSLTPSRLSDPEQRQRLAAVLPGAYEEASLVQQVAISLLVAKEILATLSITLSPSQPRIERLWETTGGTVRFLVDYDPESRDREDLFSFTPLRVRVQLPKGGSLTLQADRESITAQRTYAGYLTVELSDWQAGQQYLLEVRLNDPGQMPLKFAIVCQ